MRRRRQKNTLLPKMLGLAVLINAILLPILAQLGVFKGVHGQRLTAVQLVQAPPPPPRPKTRANRAKPHVVHHQQTARRAAPPSGRPSHAETTHLHLATALPGKGGGGTDSGPAAPVYAPPGPESKGPAGPGPAPGHPHTGACASHARPHTGARTHPASRAGPGSTPCARAGEGGGAARGGPAGARRLLRPEPAGDVPRLLPRPCRRHDHRGDAGLDGGQDSGPTRARCRPPLDLPPRDGDGRPVDSYLRLTVNFVPSDEG